MDPANNEVLAPVSLTLLRHFIVDAVRNVDWEPSQTVMIDNLWNNISCVLFLGCHFVSLTVSSFLLVAWRLREQYTRQVVSQT